MKKTLILFSIMFCLMIILSGNDEITPEEKLAGDTSVTAKITFIELGSVNCIPCKMMQPVMKSVEARYKGIVEVIFYDVKTDEGEKYGQKYSIRVIPTQIFLNEKGEEISRHEGFFPEKEIFELIDNHLSLVQKTE